VKANLNFTLVSILDWKTSPKKTQNENCIVFHFVNSAQNYVHWA